MLKFRFKIFKTQQAKSFLLRYACNCFERLGFKNFDSGFYFRRVDLNFYQNPKKVKFEAVLKTSTNLTPTLTLANSPSSLQIPPCLSCRSHRAYTAFSRYLRSFASLFPISSYCRFYRPIAAAPALLLVGCKKFEAKKREKKQLATAQARLYPMKNSAIIAKPLTNLPG